MKKASCVKGAARASDRATGMATSRASGKAASKVSGRASGKAASKAADKATSRTAGRATGKARGGKGRIIALTAFAGIMVIAICFFALGNDVEKRPKVESARAEVVVPDIKEDESIENKREHLTTATAVMPGEGKVVYYEGQ